MKTSPNQAQSSGSSFARTLHEEKTIFSALTYKAIIRGMLVFFAFAVSFSVTIVVFHFFNPGFLPKSICYGAYGFSAFMGFIVFLNSQNPHANNNFGNDPFDLSNTDGDAISIRESVGLPTP